MLEINKIDPNEFESMPKNEINYFRRKYSLDDFELTSLMHYTRIPLETLTRRYQRARSDSARQLLKIAIQYTKKKVKKEMLEKEKKIKNLRSVRRYQSRNPDKVVENNQASSHKGGKRYAKKQNYKQTGVQCKRNSIRSTHSNKWRQYKCIIAPESQIHHEWLPDTAEYRGVALVEANQHMHGIIDVIRILKGEITLSTEKDIKKGSLKL